jgi:hypothetical protein
LRVVDACRVFRRCAPIAAGQRKLVAAKFYIPVRKNRSRRASDRVTVVPGLLAGLGVTATMEVIVGWPARVIAQTATSRGTDLIVMGTHGRGTIAHLVLGSVAERVVRTAPCAVLTVRDSSRIADVLAAERDAAHKTAQPFVLKA